MLSLKQSSHQDLTVCIGLHLHWFREQGDTKQLTWLLPSGQAPAEGETAMLVDDRERRHAYKDRNKNQLVLRQCLHRTHHELQEAYPPTITLGTLRWGPALQTVVCTDEQRWQYVASPLWSHQQSSVYPSRAAVTTDMQASAYAEFGCKSAMGPITTGHVVL